MVGIVVGDADGMMAAGFLRKCQGCALCLRTVAEQSFILLLAAWEGNGPVEIGDADWLIGPKLNSMA